MTRSVSFQTMSHDSIASVFVVTLFFSIVVRNAAIARGSLLI